MNIVYKNKPGKFEVSKTVNRSQSSRSLITSQQARAALLRRWVWRWAEYTPCPHPRLGSKRGSMKRNALCWTGFDSGVFPKWCHTVAAVQSLNRVWLFATPWTVAHQDPLSSTVSRSLLQTIVGKVISPLFNILSRFVIALLPRSKRLLISWLAVTICSDFWTQENKICHSFGFFPFYLPWWDWGLESYVCMCVY